MKFFCFFILVFFVLSYPCFSDVISGDVCLLGEEGLPDEESHNALKTADGEMWVLTADDKGMPLVIDPEYRGKKVMVEGSKDNEKKEIFVDDFKVLGKDNRPIGATKGNQCKVSGFFQELMKKFQRR